MIVLKIANYQAVGVGNYPVCDPLRVELCDTAYFIFHANGSVLYYSDSKFAVDIVTGQPVEEGCG